MKRLLVTIMTALQLGTAWAGPLEDGNAAMSRNDFAVAVAIFRPLAVQGGAYAQFMLGALYENGDGVPQDYVEAVKWYRLSAAQGLVSAHHNLGVIYFDGHGAPKDYVRAHMWFNLAAESGNSASAVKNRDGIAKRMTLQQIAEAQQMARDCKQRKFKGCD